MDISVKGVVISGATIALIMRDLSSFEGDSDGILFGKLQRQTTANFQDDECAAAGSLREEITASITGHQCTGTVMGFYDEMGRLNHAKISEMIGDRQTRGGDPPIGWCMGRRNMNMRPSMREAAVTSQLRMTLFSCAMDTANSLNSTRPGLKQTPPPISAGSANFQSECRNADRPFWRDSENGVEKSTVSGILVPTSRSGISRQDPGTRSEKSDFFSQAGVSDSKAGGVARPNVCLFLLFTESNSINSVHTHEYRAFQYLHNAFGVSFGALRVSVINVGHAYRGFYNSFVPVAPLLGPGGDLIADRKGDEFCKALGVEGEINGNSVLINREKEEGGAGVPLERNSINRLLYMTYAKGRQAFDIEDLYKLTLVKLEKLANRARESDATDRYSKGKRES